MLPLAERFWASRVRICVPVSDAASGAYVLCEWRKGAALEPARFGIPEPVEKHPVRAEDVTLWIVPGLAFAKDGARLGYGGGFYDRFFSAAPGAPKIGVAYPFQIVPEIPLAPHDVPVDSVVALPFSWHV